MFANVCALQKPSKFCAGSRKKIWMPAIPLAGAFVYFAACLISPDGLLSRMFKFAEMICFVLPAFAESLILSRLIPSNDNYSALWHEASIAGGIMDFKGNICYSTKKNIPVLQEQVMEALDHPVSLEGGNMLLGSIRVQGGFGYWTKDISEINRLNRMLEDMGDVLAEENSMLEQGIYLPPSQFETNFVSVAHSPEDLQKTIDAAEIAFAEVAKARK